MERTDNDSWPSRTEIESRRGRWFLRSFVRLVDSAVFHCASIARRVGHFLYILLDQVIGCFRMSVDLTKIVDEHLRVDERRVWHPQTHELRDIGDEGVAIVHFRTLYLVGGF